jgi:hypothetical protein
MRIRELRHKGGKVQFSNLWTSDSSHWHFSNQQIKIARSCRQFSNPWIIMTRAHMINWVIHEWKGQELTFLHVIQEPTCDPRIYQNSKHRQLGPDEDGWLLLDPPLWTPLYHIDHAFTSIAIACNNQIIAELNQIRPKEKKGRALKLKSMQDFGSGRIKQRPWRQSTTVDAGR